MSICLSFGMPVSFIWIQFQIFLIFSQILQCNDYAQILQRIFVIWLENPVNRIIMFSHLYIMYLDCLEAITDARGLLQVIAVQYDISLRFLCVCIYGFNPESWINPKNVWAGRMTECLPTSKSLIDTSSSASKKLTPPRKKMN